MWAHRRVRVKRELFILVMLWLGLAWKPPLRLGFFRLKPVNYEAQAESRNYKRPWPGLGPGPWPVYVFFEYFYFHYLFYILKYILRVMWFKLVVSGLNGW